MLFWLRWLLDSATHVTEHGSEFARRTSTCVWLCLAGGALSLSLYVLDATAQSPGAPDLAAPQVAPANPLPAPRLVADIRITGNRGVTEAKIYAQVRTRKDREFDPEVLQADVRRLVSTSLFRDVKTYTEETANGVIVTFEVFERPTIRYIKFAGNRGITDKSLLKKCGLKTGEALNLYTVEEARDKLEDFYRTKGYTKIQISLLEGDDPKDQGVVFVINEGNLERIGKVTFEGNTIADDGRLKTQIESKPGFLYYLFKGRVDRKKIDEDMEKLTNYYRGLGYFRARIGRELDYDETGKWLTLRFIIDEGPRYVVRNVSIAGNEKFPTTDIEKDLTLKSGEYFNLGKMNRDVSTIRDLYGAQGHIYADITADPRFLEEPGELDLIYKVKEGDVYRVGKINVHVAGEFPHTRQNVILNRLSIRPGQIIDIREVRNSERRLKSSQLFKSDPQSGQEPRIIIPPPELDEALAERPDAPNKPRPTIRGQSPEQVARHVANSQPKEIDLNVFVTPVGELPDEKLHEPVLRLPLDAPMPQWQPELKAWPAQ
jgi:outer membrane protein insertion porin family